ncbi:MAG: DoxX family protein [Deltaproteobacteria bacterium]|jgi:putative oxidoreductase|nr:DoxX family protein [Deltaproteobacteria bacterium]MBW2530746.1 DoxX family protein [Deltaproteobacteria bacterium]
MMSQETTLPLPDDSSPDRLAELRALQKRLALQVQPVALLALRLLFGSALMLTGWSKLNSLERITAFFTNLGIPFAPIQAPAVASLEFVGGILLVVGLLSRSISVPLLVILMVALGSAHGAEAAQLFSDPGAFIGASPTPYLTALLVVFAFGPGKLSLDHLLAKRFLTAERS